MELAEDMAMTEEISTDEDAASTKIYRVTSLEDPFDVKGARRRFQRYCGPDRLMARVEFHLWRGRPGYEVEATVIEDAGTEDFEDDPVA